MFDATTILLVNNGAYDAIDLAGAIEDQGGFIAGPVDTSADAVVLLDTGAVGAAIVDCDIGAEAHLLIPLLQDRSIPYVIQASGPLPTSLYHGGRAAVFRKPIEPALMLDGLLVEIGKSGRSVS